MNIAMTTIKQDMAAVVQELKAKLPNIIEDLEDLKATQGQPPPQHNAKDRLLVKEDLHFALRQYLKDDQSTISDGSRRREPSMQVSSLEHGTIYLTSIYRTAQTHVNSEAEATENRRTPSRYMTLEIGVSGKITPIQIQPDATIHQLVTLVKATLIKATLDFTNVEVVLLHKGRCIYGDEPIGIKQDLPLHKTTICPNSELFCQISFNRPCGHKLFDWDMINIDPCQRCESRSATQSDESSSLIEDSRGPDETNDLLFAEGYMCATNADHRGVHTCDRPDVSTSSESEFVQ